MIFTKHSIKRPKNECNYSFNDLFKKVNPKLSSNDIKGLSQQQINRFVIYCCIRVNWYWETRTKDTVEYVAFSPECY